jgi:tripartite-type tricarboxylate transporter receptor subunit TctC
MKQFAATTLLAAASAFAAGTVLAQSADFPNRPVRMIIPFAPGGASDFVGRILQPKLSEELGQQVVTDNRSGAYGAIGIEMTVNAPPDGHTLILANVGTIAINPGLFPKSKIDPTRDLSAVSLVVDVPGSLVVNPSLPVTTLKEFIDYVKARPGKLNYGSAGAGSPQRLAFEYFQRKAGLDMVHIPYKGGAGGATLAVLANEVSVTMITTASVIPHVKSGKLRPIAVVSSKRVAQLPDVPTMAEMGYPELTLGSWQGLYGPAKMPQAVVKKLFATVTKVMADPWVVERLNSGGALPVTSKSPEEFASFSKTQKDFWVKIIKDTGATAE